MAEGRQTNFLFWVKDARFDMFDGQSHQKHPGKIGRGLGQFMQSLGELQPEGMRCFLGWLFLELHGKNGDMRVRTAAGPARVESHLHVRA
jgi:hypothetical protein